MNMNVKIHKSLTDNTWIFDYLVSVSIFVGSLSVYQKSKYSNYTLFACFFTLLISLICIYIISFNNKNLISRSISAGIVVFGINLVSVSLLIIMQGAAFRSAGYLRCILLCIYTPLCVSFLIAQGPNLCRFLHRFVRSLSVIVCAGILLWMLYILNIVKPNCSITLTWADNPTKKGLYGLVYFIQSLDVGSQTIMRFTSFFVEGPAFAGVLLIVLAIALYWSKNTLFDILALAIAGYLSFSTTFIILFPVLVCPKLFNYIRNLPQQKRYTFLKYVIFVFLSCSIIFGIQIIFDAFQVKMGTHSGNRHFQDIQSGLVAFAESPAIGHGLGNYEDAWKAYTVGGIASQSSAFMATLSEGGLFLIFLYIMPEVLYFFKVFSKKEYLKVIPILINFVIFFVCILDQALISYFMISICYCFWPKKLRKEIH